jgi:RNA polymerase sigma-70 factor (ECF subfamily)
MLANRPGMWHNRGVACGSTFISTGDSSMDTTPVTLLERLRTPGDEDAWPELAALITPLLLAWGRRVGLAHDDAADLAQDVLTVLVARLRSFEYDPAQSFRAWLKTITMNKWREGRRRPAMRSLDADGRLETLTAPDPESAWESEYRFQLVLRAFEAIRVDFQPHTWQACWELVVRGRRASDVAAELGLTPAAVYTAKSRVLQRLRKELEGMLE